MAKHVKSITYKPKIEPVMGGRCKQTIRMKGKKQIRVGDIITFHGWQGRPYRSSWSWRKIVVVSEVIPAELSEAGMFIDAILHAWTSWYPARLAEYDFIEPPTGEALRDVLFGLNGAPKEPVEYQIIRWG
jgi:hypothetical protein